MPVTRPPTPFPHVRRNSTRARNARKMVNKVTKFFMGRNKLALLSIIGYASFLTFFFFVMDAETDCLKNEVGPNLVGVFAGIEVTLALSLAMALLGIFKTRPLLVVPILCMQSFIIAYAATHYVYPFLMHESDNVHDQFLELQTKSTFARMRIILVSTGTLFLRFLPLIVQCFFTLLSAELFWSLVVICFVESRQTLPFTRRARRARASSSPSSRNNSVNSRVWSSMRRKIQVRRQQEQVEQAQHLSKPELYLEMSAKFRKTTFPRVHVVDESHL